MPSNSKIPSVTLTDTLNASRRRFNQLVDSVGDVSSLTTTTKNVTGAINEHDAELGTITSGAMGTTASTVSTAIAELDGRLDSINTVELLSPRMSLSDGSAVNTIAGKLEVSDSADFKDNLSVQGNLAVGGNTTMSGTLTVDGEVTFKAGTNSNINLGDANTDNVVFNADVNSNIIPNTDNAYDLGSSTQEWRHVYVDGTVNADNLIADSATIGTAKISDLTSGRITFAGTSGELTDDADLTYNTSTDTFATSNIDIGTSAALASAKVEDLTNNRVVIVGTGGELEDDGNLTFDGTTFEVGTSFDVIASSGNTTIGGTFDVTGATNLNNTTQASSTTSGALIVDGGVGIAKKLYVGGDTVLTSDLAVNGGDITTTETTFNLVNANATTLNIGSAATAISIGSHNSGITTVQHDLVVDSNLTVHGITSLDSTNLTGMLAVTGDITVSNDFTVSGDFVVQGETKNVASFTVMNTGISIANSNRAGLAVDRPTDDSAVIQWNEFGDYWEVGTRDTKGAGGTDDVKRLARQNDSATFTNLYQTGTGATRIPAGTTAQRPTAKQGQVRYNTDLSAFEGYSGSNWGSLGGLIDVDQDTKIIAERFASNDSDTLTFITGGVERASLNDSGFDIEPALTINDTTNSTNTTTGALVVKGGAGIANDLYVGGGINITNNTIHGGDILSGSTSRNIFPNVVETINFATAATDLDIGATTGNTKIRNNLDVAGITTLDSATVDGTLVVERSLLVSDSAYITGNLDVGGNFTVTGTTSLDTATIDGSLLVSDSAYITGNLDVGGTLKVNQIESLTGTEQVYINDTLELQANDINDVANIYLRDKLYHDADTNTYLEFGADNIKLRTGGTDRVEINNNEVIFSENLKVNDSAYVTGNFQVGGNTVLEGNLTVQGTTTTINTETLSLQDNKILLNSNSAATPTEDAGLEVERGNSNNVFLQWDEGADRWRFTNDGSTFYNIPISTEYNKTATSTVLGGIKLSSDTEQTTSAESVTTTSNRTYGIQVNSSGQAVVNVPWTDNDTVYSLPAATSTVRGGIELYSDTQAGTAESVTTTSNRTYGIQVNSAGQAVVNVPWVDTNTTYSAGTDLDLSGTTFNIESELNGVNSIKAPTNDSLTIASHAFLKLYSGHTGGSVTGSNTMQLYAANYQFSFGTDATNQFGIYEDATLGGPKLTTTQAGDNLAIDAGGDIYLRPTGDDVYMQGTTSSEQIQFNMGTSYQSIQASDTLAIRGTGYSTGAGRVTVQSNDQFPGLRIGDITQTALTGTSYENMEISARYIACNMYDGGAGSSSFTGTRTSTSSSTSGSGAMYFEHGDGSTGGWEFYADTTPFSSTASIIQTFKIDTDGNVTATGDVTAYSDVRIKDNIETIDGALDIVENLRGVYYTRTDVPDRAKDKRHVGVIAQEVNEVLPEVVNYREKEDKYTVDYGKMVGVLIEAMKEQQQQIDDLKEEIRLMKE